jgi:hypothetical protein
MVGVVRALGVLFIVLTASLICGCEPLDSYAFRSIQYNLEAEQTQNQVILLNIVRASLQRPMEFTEITNIVGSNSASGTTSFSFPVGFRLPTGVTTGSAGGTLTGTTTFTIPVLDTQDFYEGLLNDIQPQLFGYYVVSPFVAKDLILNLFIERITVRVSDGSCTQLHLTTCERDFRNYPGSAEDIALFQTFVSYLESLQISVEQEASSTNGKSQSAQTNAASGGTSGTGGTSANTNSSGSSAPAPRYRLCFAPRVQTLPPPITCGYKAPKGTKAGGGEIAPRTTVTGVPFPATLAQIMRDEIIQLGDENNYGPSIGAFSDRNVSVTFQFRSTGSIFNFLGQLVDAVRMGGPVISLYRSQFHKPLVPCWVLPTDPSACKPIILVHKGLGSTLVSVGYDSTFYSVPSDPEVSFSPAVFTILKQLVALNLSGKNLPTTAILSVTSAGP